MEFLVRIELDRIDLPAAERSSLIDLEAQRAKELIKEGHLKYLWRIPGQRANWGIWSANNADELHSAISSLPLFDYMSVTVHPLATHPNAPQSQKREMD